MKIMVIDDNVDMREMIRSVVFDEDDDIMECEDGSEAVKEFPRFHPDYVLMDIEMKIMDGFTTAEKIYEQDADAKIIFVTNYNTAAFQRRAETLHATGFVGKENLMEIKNLIQSHP